MSDFANIILSHPGLVMPGAFVAFLYFVIARKEFPRVLMNDVVDSPSLPRKGNRQISHADAFRIKLKHFGDFLVRKYRRWLVLTSTDSPAQDRTSHVFNMSSSSDVTNARRVVAKVHNFFSFWNRPELKNVRKAMGAKISVVNQYSIAVLPSDKSSPKPTLTESRVFHWVWRGTVFVNETPKMFFECLHGGNKKPARWSSSAVCTADTGREKGWLDALDCIIGRLCGTPA